MIRLLEFILLGTFCLGLLTFVVTYFQSNWRTNLVGKYIMYFMIAMFVVFVYIMLGPIVRSYPGRQIVDIVILLAINYGAWKIVWLLYKIRKNGKVDDDEVIRRR